MRGSEEVAVEVTGSGVRYECGCGLFLQAGIRPQDSGAILFLSRQALQGRKIFCSKMEV